ncbi:MAG: BREX system ATP-binding protein BrxD, partial [Actinomycetales bacterium]|nr:BREX system ATP-binding protein BrxD [Actinomycetales bacterium]
FLRKLVDVMDRVDQFPDFHPRRDYALTVDEAELRDTEREARALGEIRRPGRGVGNVDDVELDV